MRPLSRTLVALCAAHAVVARKHHRAPKGFRYGFYRIVDNGSIGKVTSDAIFSFEYGGLVFDVGCIAKLCKKLFRQEAGMLWLLRKGGSKPAQVQSGLRKHHEYLHVDRVLGKQGRGEAMWIFAKLNWRWCELGSLTLNTNRSRV